MSVISFFLPLAGPGPTGFSQVRPSQSCQSTDEGISIVVQVVDAESNPVNLRVATAMHILTLRPSGIAMPVPARLYTNGFDGQMYFTSEDILPYGTGLSEVGTWQVQGKITIAGNTQFTAIGAFSVNKNLGA